MKEMEIAKAGHEFMAVVDRVRDMSRRGYTEDEIEKVLQHRYEVPVVRLASKFLLEVKAARLGKAVLLCACIGLSGCLPAIGNMPATGWRVSFGIDPIDGIDDTRQLNQAQIKTRAAKY